MFSLWSCNPLAYAMCLIGCPNAVECKHFSLPLKSSRGQSSTSMYFGIAVHPTHSLPQCMGSDWLKYICIDLACPTQESVASCSLTQPEESPRQIKGCPVFPPPTKYTFLRCQWYADSVMCHHFFPFQCVHAFLKILFYEYLIYKHCSRW